jgi:hypothetical protein
MNLPDPSAEGTVVHVYLYNTCLVRETQSSENASYTECPWTRRRETEGKTSPYESEEKLIGLGKSRKFLMVETLRGLRVFTVTFFLARNILFIFPPPRLWTSCSNKWIQSGATNRRPSIRTHRYCRCCRGVVPHERLSTQGPRDFQLDGLDFDWTHVAIVDGITFHQVMRYGKRCKVVNDVIARKDLTIGKCRKCRHLPVIDVNTQFSQGMMFDTFMSVWSISDKCSAMTQLIKISRTFIVVNFWAFNLLRPHNTVQGPGHVYNEHSTHLVFTVLHKCISTQQSFFS